MPSGPYFYLMTTKRDYYDILEVSRNATEEEIRKAFRRKALEYHPDRNKSPNAAEQFKEVNEAYQVLTDPDRRAQYNRFGHAGVGAYPGGAGFARGSDAEDLLGGYGSIFEAFFGKGPNVQTRTFAGADIETDLRISFAEAAFGAPKEFTVKRMEACQRCEGRRTEPGHQLAVCSNCQGAGEVRRMHRSIFGQFVQQGTCPACHGEGKVVTHPCTECRGLGVQQRQRQVRFDIPAGVEDGARIQLRGEGDADERSGPPGDLYILLRVEPHPFFQRSGYDIFYGLDLTFPQIALGDEVMVPTLEGEVALKVPPGTQSSTTFRLKGHGIPRLGRSSQRGDELVTVRVKTPDRLTKEQQELLEALRRSFNVAKDGKGNPDGSKG